MAHATGGSCSACHAPARETNLVTLLEIGAGQEEQDEPARVTFCSACLARREPQAWSRRERDGRALWAALEARALPLWGRYRYFADEAAIHLLRVDHDWAHGHEPAGVR